MKVERQDAEFLSLMLMQHPTDPVGVKTKEKHILDPPVDNRRNIEGEVKVSVTIIIDSFPTVDCIPTACS